MPRSDNLIFRRPGHSKPLQPKTVGISPNLTPIENGREETRPVDTGSAKTLLLSEGMVGSSDATMDDSLAHRSTTEALGLNDHPDNQLVQACRGAWDEKLFDPPELFELHEDSTQPEPPQDLIPYPPISTARVYSDDPAIAARQKSVAICTDMTVFYAGLQKMLDEAIKASGYESDKFDGLKAVFSQASQDCVSLARIASAETTALAKAHAAEANRLAVQASSKRVDVELDQLINEIEMLPKPAQRAACTAGVKVAPQLQQEAATAFDGLPPDLVTLYQALNEDESAGDGLDEMVRSLEIAQRNLVVADEDVNDEVEYLVSGFKQVVETQGGLFGSATNAAGIPQTSSSALATSRQADDSGPAEEDESQSDDRPRALSPTTATQLQDTVESIIDMPDAEFQALRKQQIKSAKPSTGKNDSPPAAESTEKSVNPIFNSLHPSPELLEELRQRVAQDPRNPAQAPKDSGLDAVKRTARKMGKEVDALRAANEAAQKIHDESDAKLKATIEELDARQEKDRQESERLMAQTKRLDKEPKQTTGAPLSSDHAVKNLQELEQVTAARRKALSRNMGLKYMTSFPRSKQTPSNVESSAQEIAEALASTKGSPFAPTRGVKEDTSGRRLKDFPGDALRQIRSVFAKR